MTIIMIIDINNEIVAIRFRVTDDKAVERAKLSRNVRNKRCGHL